MKLNLGCGNDIWEGWINLDLMDDAGANVIHDLDKFPYPFKDNTFDKIVANNLIEHLHKPNEFIKELWRISKNDCEIEIITPHFSSWDVWEDISHLRPFAYRSLCHFDIKRSSPDDVFLNPKVIKFNMNVKIKFGKLYTLFGISFLANKFPIIYESLFAYIFQSRKVIYNLRAIK